MYYIFLAEGFEIVEALAPLDMMRRAKLSVKTVGVTGEVVTSSCGVPVKADMALADLTYNGIEGAILPGGMPGTRNLEASERVLDCVKYCVGSGKLVCAICAAPSILGHLGILDGKRATCFPGFEKDLYGANHTAAHVETDGNVITAKGAGCAIEFGAAIVAKALSPEDSDRVMSDMQCF